MKLAKVELNDLIEGCKQGKRKHQQQIYQMYYSKMLSVAFRYARNEDEAKDILQDSFIKIFEKIERYNSEGSFEGWIRRIVVNTAIDYYRKQKKEFLMENEDRLEDEAIEDDAPESAYAGVSITDVVEATQRLSPAYRTVFNLYIMDGYSHQEIAEELEISVGTSKSNLAKAKANVKKYLMEKLK